MAVSNKNFHRNKYLNRSFYLFILLFFTACAWKPYPLTKRFADVPTPPKPDYALEKNWAALPNIKDSADVVPLQSNLKEAQANAQVDVFFVYPTIFTGEPTNEFHWNADVADAKLNQQIDGSTIMNQATAFNGSCRVYAPRYRQSHYYAFVTPHKEDKASALNLAYEDVKAAFEYYLKNYNQGRPIVIAAHSQGTIHAGHLMKEFFDGKPLQKQLVQAYLVGIALPPNLFEHIKPSKSPEETGGWVSWNTFAKDFVPDYYQNGLSASVCTNPITWKINDDFASEKLNVGAVGLGFKYERYAVDAQCHQGLLWVNKPYIRGRALINTKIWHKADINFFWGNMRENVATRIGNWNN